MSQVFKENITYETGNEFEFMMQIEVVTESTETKKSETDIISLEISDNESLDGAEKEMDKLSKNSIKEWESIIGY